MANFSKNTLNKTDMKNLLSNNNVSYMSHNELRNTDFKKIHTILINRKHIFTSDHLLVIKMNKS